MPPPLEDLARKRAEVCATSFLLALIAHRVGIIKLNCEANDGIPVLQHCKKNLERISHEHDSQRTSSWNQSRGQCVSLAKFVEELFKVSA